MEKEAAQYSLNLTLGELLFAARQAGLEHLPVLAQDVRALSAEELIAEQHAGRDLLETRGLLHRAASGQWRMDGFLALAAQWLAAPEQVLMLKRVQRGEGVFQFTAYFKMQKALLAEYRHSEFRLRVYKDDGALQAQLNEWMGVKLQAEATSQLPAMSHVEFLAFQSALASPAAASVTAAHRAWERVMFVSSLTHVNWSSGSPRVEREIGFAGNEAELWQIDRAASASDTVAPIAVAAAQAREKWMSLWPGETAIRGGQF